MNNVKQTLDVIHAHGRFSGKASLYRIRALMDALGNPQRTLRFVHIAGTNGKGSSALLTAAALEQAGYQTGLFISPYVLDFRERIQINRDWISPDDLAVYTERVLTAEQSLILDEGEKIGEFEFTTALALLYFAEHDCDIVVLEVGLGGRYDATNVIDAPEVAVMTHIALDHMAVLGNTVEEIAADKSHIVKPGTVLVSAPKQPGNVPEILRARCVEVGADYVETALPETVSSDLMGSSFACKGKQLFIKMIGSHQVQNAATAYEVLLQLRKKGWNIPDGAIEQAFSTAVMPARQEILSHDPLLLIDGAHNLDGVGALCATLDEMLPPGGISFILGMVEDKQYRACIQMLTRRADNVYAVAADTPRAIPSAEIASCVREYSPYTNAFDCGDVRSALRRAQRSATEDDVIVVCGSLYVAAEAENILRADRN
ncbi:MAG: folylpolyglutamate synthase/dihydrofolate synthase family protein [Eubacteriales bacterium]|nr:folylpolyglutamate synthase/dihydrofolate synthase family protein [Eubacteriales bacterium]